jgi:hypothetical protein
VDATAKPEVKIEVAATETERIAKLRAEVRAVILEAGDDAGTLTYKRVRQALEVRDQLGSSEYSKKYIKAAMVDEWSLVKAEQATAAAAKRPETPSALDEGGDAYRAAKSPEASERTKEKKEDEQDAGKVDGTDMWSCPACTYKKSPLLPNCEMCKTMKAPEPA